MRTILIPGASRGTRIMDCCLYLSGFLGSVLPMKMSILQRGSPIPEVHHLWPLTTYSSPSRTMEASMFVASDEATLGSVMAKAERILPSSSGASPVLPPRQEEVPEPPLPRLGLQLLHDGRHLPARRLGVELIHERLLARGDVLVHELGELLHVHLRPLGVFEFHPRPPPIRFRGARRRAPCRPARRRPAPLGPAPARPPLGWASLRARPRAASPPGGS